TGRNGDDREHHAFDGHISVPKPLDEIITAITGLHTPPVYPHIRKEEIFQPAVVTPITPPQLATLYNLPASTGSGQTAGIVTLGGGWATADLQATFSTMSLSVPTIVTVSVDGGGNNYGTILADDAENTLDISTIGGVVNSATIVMYAATNTINALGDAISTAVHDNTNNPHVVSI